MLWQDCPYVAFLDLKSEEAQARLSVCQPISGLQEVTRVGGVERYAHQSGEAHRVLSFIVAGMHERAHAYASTPSSVHVCNVRACRSLGG